MAKSDVRWWPVIGPLAEMFGTVFIERTSAGLRDARQKVQDVVKKGKPVLIFPEATSADGVHILPFKSTLI